ncbi:hypothetical protein BGZ51_006540 [Haplosporangium sp. Z 767]|nr:hypothetical protein BGZ51_006540 [Haplosporangium sp. Z 767]KAF9196627.1 hypothetical protein BGZ50_008572 [Haplosporangium sp. Z 11]
MYKSIIALTVAIAFGSAIVSAAPAEQGSWCYKPQHEKFWGQASAECCRPNGGHMAENRRCYGLHGNGNACRAFYACCIGTWNSGNHIGDRCY